MSHIRKQLFPNLIFFLMGCLVFSNLSSLITVNILHFPFALPEIIFMPLLILVRKYIFPLEFDGKLFLKLFYVLILLFAISLLWNIFDIISILSTSRGFLYLCLFFCIFVKPNKQIKKDYFCILALGSLVGWAVSALLNFKLALTIGNDDSAVAIYGTMMAIPLFFSLSIKRRKLFITGIFVIVVISIFSGVRRQILVTLVSLLWVLIFTKKDKNVIYVIISSTLSIFIFVFFFFSKVKDFINDNFYVLYIRVFSRTVDTLHGADESDIYRLRSIFSIFKNLEKYLVPHGIATLNTSKYEFVGIYNDYPFLLIIYMFGFIIAVFILIWLIKLFLRSMRKLFLYKSADSVFASLSIFVIILLLFVEGTYIHYPYSVPVTGLCLGKAYLYTKNYYE